MKEHSCSAVKDAAPVIVRVAGLPHETLDSFATTLTDAAARLDASARVLAEARAGLADALHEAVPTAEPTLRRVLLAVRRDAYNGRPLRRHLASPFWPALQMLAGEGVDRVLALEKAHETEARSFEAAFAAAREREGTALLGPLRNRAFVRGLALASPDLARAGRALAARTDCRTDRKAECALLRYVSRAAGKVSPFSTFTPVGLGAVCEGAPPHLSLAAFGWRTRSLVRIKPYLLDQVAAMLRLWAPFRTRLEVTLNRSLIETEPGRFLFIRPVRWTYSAEAGKLLYHDEAMVALGLRGPLFERLKAELAAGTPTYAMLVASLEENDLDNVGAHIDELVRIGVLALVLPWSSHAPHLEKEILQALKALPGSEQPQGLVETLEQLVTLEDGYADALDPPATLDAIEHAIEALWNAAAPLGGLPKSASRGKPTARNVYEDVWIEPKGAPTPELLRISRAAADEALQSAAPLARMSALFDRRADLLDTLAAFAGERWPELSEIAVPELFRAFGRLWGDYQRFRAESLRGDGWRALWNPLSLPSIDARARARVAVWEALLGCICVDGDVQHVSVAALNALLDHHAAPGFDEAGGACLFLQPASVDGRLWMMNRLKEGTGRFGSRYTPVMSPETRDFYTRALAMRGTFTIDGETADLLDLADVQGDTLNVHAVQTPAILDGPGETDATSEARRVRLADLRVTFGGGRAVLRGCDGQRYVAVHLGVAYDQYMPPLNRFLSVFGPSESAGVFPAPSTEPKGEVVYSRRTVLGSLVIHRRSWSFDAPTLSARLEGLSDAAAFVVLARWRAEHEIPERVFLAERVLHPLKGERVQPQYLDLTSPLFVALFRGILAQESASVRIAEALPDAYHLPRDQAGRRWAVEVLLDSLALRDPFLAGQAARNRSHEPRLLSSGALELFPHGSHVRNEPSSQQGQDMFEPDDRGEAHTISPMAPSPALR